MGVVLRAAVAAVALLWGADSVRAQDRQYYAGMYRVMAGIDVGPASLDAKTNHFFPQANVSGSEAGATGSVYGEFHYAYWSGNGVTGWIGAGPSILFGDMAVTTGPNFGDEILDSRIDWVASVRGRLSWQFARTATSPDFCIVIKGGPAFSRIRDSFAGESISSTKTGWEIGAGLEFAVGRNWVAGVSYTHIDAGTTTIPLGTGVPVEHKIDRFAFSIGYRLYPNEPW